MVTLAPKINKAWFGFFKFMKETTCNSKQFLTGGRVAYDSLLIEQNTNQNYVLRHYPVSSLINDMRVPCKRADDGMLLLKRHLVDNG